MLTDIDFTSNEEFQHKFRRINLIWLAVLTIYMGVFVFAILLNKPSYLHDWHAITIIALSSLMIAIYLMRVRILDNQWPPRLFFALSTWLSMYLVVVLLSTIDSDFAWCLYMVYGISFTVFSSRRLILAVCIIALTLFAYQGLLWQPLQGYNLISIFGQTLGLLATTLFGMLAQHLIYERYERNILLQQLTETNRELAQAHRQIAESAQQEQELAVLRERTRFARDIHDTLGHALVLISVKLEAAQRLRELDPQRSDRELEATKEVVRESMKELRASIANLRSPTLEREPAIRALTHYTSEMALRTGMQVTCDLQPDAEGLPDSIEETLWKVGQEALANIEKHAAARHVTLHISRNAGSVLMRISDDGIGIQLSPNTVRSTTVQENQFARNMSPHGHYGLCGMYERVESVGGHISIANINTPTSSGTTVEVTLPLIEEPRIKSSVP
jgi:signal transduction histidine kinase